MGKRKSDKIIVRAVGESAVDVTGSSYLVEIPTKDGWEKYLLDCGMYQSHNPYESYKINSRKFKFKPSELDGVFVSHINIDHYANLCRLYKDGANCPIYISYKTIDFLNPMLKDCAKIAGRDAIMFSKKLQKNIKPLYDDIDVERVLPYFRGTSVGEMIKISENLTVRFLYAGHIFGSTQIQLFIKTITGNTKVISYTGDLGNILFEQPFTEEFTPIIKTNMLIGECTYNSLDKSCSKGQREKDLEKLKTSITETCITNHGQLLIPVFALQRVETLLYYIWQLFKDNENFKIPVIVDSPLAMKLLRCFNDNLDGEWKEKFDEMLKWKNIRLVGEYDDSMSCITSNEPHVVLSSSGMLTQGRSVLYAQQILPKRNCTILFCGYAGVGTLANKLKNNKQKTMTVNGKVCACRCNIVNLRSFSCHMQANELLNYYTNISNNGCDVIWLVHSDKNKVNFKAMLEDRIANINKTTKVIATNTDTVARI